MRISPLLTFIGAGLAVIVIVVVGARVLQPNRPLLADVSFSLSTISPNADGLDDVTVIRYTLNRTAKVTVSLTNAATNQRFTYRENETRPANNYQVLFSGVVDGYTLPGETIVGKIERRLIPNGEYTWLVVAVDDGGTTAQSEGKLIVKDGDSALPDLTAFEISPQVFTPNQDGYDDRVTVNTYLTKPADLSVYLNGPNGVPIFIGERFEGREPGDPGAHVFDYDGGVDLNIEPPPDGTYTVIASAQDKVGQRVTRTGTVTIKDGGLPNSEIVPQTTGRTVTWSSLAYQDAFFSSGTKAGTPVPLPDSVQSTQAKVVMPKDDLLVFRVTVRNYGTVPIRTSGPWPGTVYQWDQTRAGMLTTDSKDQDTGAFQVGIQCERSGSVYPWRWTIGAQDALTKVEREGETLWYLMPGKQAVVWGAVRMTALFPTRNPQKCFAALIHEGVDIPPNQDHLGEIDVQLTVPKQ